MCLVILGARLCHHGCTHFATSEVNQPAAPSNPSPSTPSPDSQHPPSGEVAGKRETDAGTARRDAAGGAADGPKSATLQKGAGACLRAGHSTVLGGSWQCASSSAFGAAPQVHTVPEVGKCPWTPVGEHGSSVCELVVLLCSLSECALLLVRSCDHAWWRLCAW